MHTFTQLLPKVVYLREPFVFREQLYFDLLLIDTHRKETVRRTEVCLLLTLPIGDKTRKFKLESMSRLCGDQ